MDLTVDTTVQTRLAVLPKPRMLSSLATMVHGLQKRKPVMGLDFSYEPFRAWAADPEWAQTYLSSNVSREALHTLLLAPELTRTGSFTMGPGILRCTLGVAPDAITQEAAKGWINQLIQLAALAEKTPPLVAVTVPSIC